MPHSRVIPSQARPPAPDRLRCPTDPISVPNSDQETKQSPYTW